jgi:hypothetical protein
VVVAAAGSALLGAPNQLVWKVLPMRELGKALGLVAAAPGESDRARERRGHTNVPRSAPPGAMHLVVAQGGKDHQDG